VSGHELNHSSGTAHARREPADLLGAPGTDAQIRPVPARPHPLDRKPRGPERRVATIADLGQREANALVGSLESLLRDPIPESARSRVSTACALITSRAPRGATAWPDRRMRGRTDCARPPRACSRSGRSVTRGSSPPHPAAAADAAARLITARTQPRPGRKPHEPSLPPSNRLSADARTLGAAKGSTSRVRASARHSWAGDAVMPGDRRWRPAIVGCAHIRAGGRARRP
jgi:hypothetical protein